MGKTLLLILWFCFENVEVWFGSLFFFQHHKSQNKYRKM